MTDHNFRLDRVERLMRELIYELERGVLEREIPEELNLRHIIPLSRAIPDGVVGIRFEMRPYTRAEGVFLGGAVEPRFRVVKGGRDAPIPPLPAPPAGEVG